MLGVRIVGTVVVGKRQLLRPAAQPGEGVAEPLPGRRHGLVARSRKSGSDSSSSQVKPHDLAIVNGVPVEGSGYALAQLGFHWIGRASSEPDQH